MDRRRCEHCRQAPATIKFVKQVGDEVSAHYFCAACAAELGLPADGDGLSLATLLTAFANLESGGGSERAAEPACRCGLTFSAFRESGRFGCARCYATFAPQVEKLMRKIHRSARHTGQVPQRQAAALSRHRELAQLQQELQAAVRREAYEEAAQLRDRIRLLAAATESAPA